MSKSIIIIGAGIAGLSAGCYARMNGYETTIFELHSIPGGLCTSWDRKGYTIDGCIHYLFGSGPGQPFHETWVELGAIQNRPIVDHDEFMHIVGPNGERLIVYSDPDRLEAHMKALAPEDSRLIESFANGIRTFTKFDMSLLQAKPRSTMSADEWGEFALSVFPFAVPLAKWGMTSAAELATRFENPFLQRAIPLMFAWPDCPVMVGQSLLAYMHTRNAGFPVGGSLEFARAIEQRYRQLGGEITYDAQVQKILVENNKAVGVRLYDDSVHKADVVISAADGHGTVFDLLGGEYVDRDLRRTYDGHLPIHSVVQVSLGVNRDLSSEPHWTTYLLDSPIEIANEKLSDIGVKHYCYDPTLAPPGKSVVTILLKANYNYWQRIYGRKIYDVEQLQIGDTVGRFLDGVYPGFCDDVEVEDVATPMSYERYTGNWFGSACGWLLTKETMRLMIQGMPKTLPGLENFYMAGQWVEPGGSVPVAAMSGRNAIQLICHEEKRPFTTTTP